MMTEEDEAFNDIERQAKQRMEAVRAVMRAQYEDRTQLNGSNGVNNDEIMQMALWSGFDEKSAKFDIRLAYFYKFVETKLKEKNT
jgi:hypothetical protein